eukprot:GILJ01000680.1.p1 GENE.GILJ01000680.1~~GILJ01000680.1.p1  ORF type:complete len:374 (-),score=30.07 GILJ01000680.1:140-1261(-)
MDSQPPTLQTMESQPLMLPAPFLQDKSFEFDFDIMKVDPQPLVSAATGLLQQVRSLSSPFHEAFRLELKRNSTTGKWELRLKLLSISWFDCLVSGHGEAHAVTVAMDYVAKCLQEIGERPPIPASDTLIASQTYCSRPADCTFGRTCRNGAHANIFCKELTKDNDGKQSKCNWFVRDELVIAPNIEGYVVMCRADPISELQIAPNPKVLGHFDNNILVTRPDFWRVVFQFIENIELKTTGTHVVEGIAINFGKWETKMSVNPRAVDCHAHAHILINGMMMDELAKGNGWTACAGRTMSPEDYLEKDIRDLQSYRLLFYETKRAREERHELETRVNNLSDAVDKLSSKVENGFLGVKAALDLITAKLFGTNSSV